MPRTHGCCDDPWPWAQWRSEPALPAPTRSGVEEEVMLLDPRTLGAGAGDRARARRPARRPPGARRLRDALGGGRAQHRRPHDRGRRARRAAHLQRRLSDVLGPMGLACAACGTHPFAVWQDMVISARRPPPARVGVDARARPARADVRAARPRRRARPRGRGARDQRACARTCRCCSRCRPTRRSGRGATRAWPRARTPLFQAFPRVGIPRAFARLRRLREAVDLLIRCDAFPDPTFLWWDVRPQPRFGTVETRIMDAQSTLTGTARARRARAVPRAPRGRARATRPPS